MYAHDPLERGDPKYEHLLYINLERKLTKMCKLARKVNINKMVESYDHNHRTVNYKSEGDESTHFSQFPFQINVFFLTDLHFKSKK